MISRLQLKTKTGKHRSALLMLSWSMHSLSLQHHNNSRHSGLDLTCSRLAVFCAGLIVEWSTHSQMIGSRPCLR